MVACWRCGGEIQNTDRICPSCGQPTGYGLNLAEPATAATDPVAAEPRAPWAAVIGVAVLVAVLIGFFAVATRDDPADETANDEPRPDAADDPDRSDDEPVGDGERVGGDDITRAISSEPPDYVTTAVRRSLTVSTTTSLDGWVIGAASLGESLLVLSAGETVQAVWGVNGRDISAHRRSADGTWEDLGPVLPGATVAAVTSVDETVYVTGRNARGEPMLWESTDGATWLAELLPPTEADSVPAQIAATADTVLIVGSPRIPFLELTAEIQSAGVDLGPFDWPEITSSGDLIVRGPLGVPVETIDLAAIGIEDVARRAVGSSNNLSATWARTGNEWRVTDSPFQGFGPTMASDNAFHRPTGASIERSLDGIEWETAAASTSAWFLTAWRDRFIAAIGQGDFEVRDPGLDLWFQASFPGSASPHTLTAGPAGMAVLAVAPSLDRTDISPIVLRRGGATAWFGVDDRIRIETDEHTLDNVFLYEVRPNDPRLVVDADAETVTFVESDSGGELITVTFAELETVHAALHPPPTLRHQVLFSREGREWALGELGIQEPSRVHVDETRITVFAPANTEAGFQTVVLTIVVGSDG